MILPLSNILHYKLRSLLAAMGVAVSLCMVITLTGLARGSLEEPGNRWNSIDADLIVYPSAYGDNITTLNGIAVSDRLGNIINEKHPGLCQEIVPVFLWPIRIGGQDHLSAGVDAEHLNMLTGNRGVREGRGYGPKQSWPEFIKMLQGRRAAATDDSSEDIVVEPTEAELAEGGYLDLVIDSRLADAAKLKVGDTIRAVNHTWNIVGVTPHGGMCRIYLPRKTAQYLFGSGDTSRSTVLFAKLTNGKDPNDAARDISTLAGTTAVQTSQYRDMLMSKFAIMYVYVDAVNAVALLIAFLFVMTTLYMTVLQRTREIAILKSFGASRAYLFGQVFGESLLLAIVGLIMGLGLSFPAAWAIGKYKPFLTVDLSWRWVLLGSAAALAGAFLATILPAWRAAKVDMLEALSYE